MSTQQLVEQWFALWGSGQPENLPLADDFTHTSPYGTIEGKAAYMALVEANRDKFLGNTFEVHDALYEGNRACVRYTMRSGDFVLPASEWFFTAHGKIERVVSYYNIEGEVSEARTLSS